MDLLFKRYASPFLLLDSYIEQCRLFDFVIEFFNIRNEEMTWEVWLHKVYDKSFDEFKNSIDTMEYNEFSKEQIETTVKDSHNILIEFNPNMEGGD